MKALGIDFGSKRIGIAISDEEKILAFPHSVLKNDDHSIELISRLVSDNEVDTIVIGESKDYKMEDNQIMESANRFAEELKINTGIFVTFYPEFMTSMQVEKEHFQLSEKGKKRGIEKVKDVDAKAATIMLQSYLDANKE